MCSHWTECTGSTPTLPVSSYFREDFETLPALDTYCTAAASTSCQLSPWCLWTCTVASSSAELIFILSQRSIGSLVHTQAHSAFQEKWNFQLQLIVLQVKATAKYRMLLYYKMYLDSKCTTSSFCLSSDYPIYYWHLLELFNVPEFCFVGFFVCFVTGAFTEPLLVCNNYPKNPSTDNL